MKKKGFINEIGLFILTMLLMVSDRLFQNELPSTVTFIRTNIEQASAGTQQVTNNIAGVTQLSNEVGGVAEDVLNAATILGENSEKMKAEVEIFLGQIRQS